MVPQRQALPIETWPSATRCVRCCRVVTMSLRALGRWGISAGLRGCFVRAKDSGWSGERRRAGIRAKGWADVSSLPCSSSSAAADRDLVEAPSTRGDDWGTRQRPQGRHTYAHLAPSSRSCVEWRYHEFQAVSRMAMDSGFGVFNILSGWS